MSAQPDIISFGCRLNIAEAEGIRAAASGDVVVINSCAVTAEAVRQARQAVRRAARARPNARIIVTGCAAQIAPDDFAAMPEVTTVIGNREKFAAASYFGANARIRVDDIFAPAPALPAASSYTTHTRAFVEVQTGCDHRCTFCVIPYGRGNARSVPAGAVIDRIKALVATGINEVVLTGVDLTSYGPDLPGAPTLGALVQRILRHVPDLPRLRLSSIDSIEVDPALFDAVAGDARVMPHLHLSLQSGDNMILKRMKRRHSREQAIDFCARIRAARPDIALGADLIAGFPTETEAMFENSLALVDDCGLTQLHVFAYSERAGTPAARMPQLPVAVRRARAALLRSLGEARYATWLAAQIGRPQRVLVEASGRTGHAENFARVRLARAHPRGAIVTAVPTAVADGMLECS
jgi:threonylcarbamoyladenosine tRNA methylthiotransferase MtaB